MRYPKGQYNEDHIFHECQCPLTQNKLFVIWGLSGSTHNWTPDWLQMTEIIFWVDLTNVCGLKVQ